MGMSPNARLNLLWTKRIENNFNVLLVGKVFKSNQMSLVAGCDDGVIRVFEVPSNDSKLPLKCISTLETKGGPIQVLALHNVMKFASIDVITGDSKGMLTVFSNGQILSRQPISNHSLNCLQILQDATGAIAIVCSDNSGSLFAASPYNAFEWKIRLGDVIPSREIPTTIKSVLSVSLPNVAGHNSSYILASDDQHHLYIIHQGSIVLILDTPSNITAMCAGRFLHNVGLETPGGPVSTNSPGPQVALGSESGGIYLFSNFELYQEEYANTGMSITQMCVLASQEAHEVDTIICAGHANAVVVFNNAKEIARYATSDWVNSISTTNTDRDREKTIIVGCLDNSIQALKLTYF
ncbi:uncharacterized protein LOC141914237 [Tubulanus polymorphus]|uniref:uncharacterized protein LOC141914237 n=1 Tax=Tubulanus polymorphus TaxID=672921 RepID=UPI003DA3D5D9